MCATLLWVEQLNIWASADSVGSVHVRAESLGVLDITETVFGILGES